MSENWIAFLAGAVWLTAFTAGLFAFANWVQRRDRQRYSSHTWQNMNEKKEEKAHGHSEQ